MIIEIMAVKQMLKQVKGIQGMVHMITIWTYKAHIDIGEYKTPIKYPKTAPFLYPKHKCQIPNMLPDNPKKDARRSQKGALQSQKSCLTIIQLMYTLLYS